MRIKQFSVLNTFLAGNTQIDIPEPHLGQRHRQYDAQNHQQDNDNDDNVYFHLSGRKRNKHKHAITK